MKHTREYFRIVIPTLNFFGRDIRLFSQQLNFLLTDTECKVRQLAAAFRTQIVAFFPTITCNQQKHPGVGPLLNALDFLSKKLQKLLIKNCSSGNSCPMLESSFSEGILGKINKIWGRAKVQTAAGNLPHYHF